MLRELSLTTIREARRRIAPFVLRTPVLHRRHGDDCELLLKAESLQATGAFKLRGAFNMMLTLPKGCPGVVAHSSGNHAQAVARAARILRMRAVIAMPADAPELKRARTAADGAEIVSTPNDSDVRAQRAAEISREQGLVLVPPFDHPLVAAGQGTAALELLDEADLLHRFYAPVSGGGLMSGCAVAIHALSPNTELIGVEPEDGNDTQLSLAAGERCKVPPPKGIADGLSVRTPGEQTWPVLQRHLSRVELVRDDELLDAMAWALRELRLVLEPSGAAALAVALRVGRGRCGVLLSGGNPEPALLAEAARRAASATRDG